MTGQQMQINNIVALMRQTKKKASALFSLLNPSNDLNIQITDLLAQGVAIKAQ